MRLLSRLVLSCVLAFSLLTAPVAPRWNFIQQQAYAQTPTIDLSSLAKLKEIIGTVNQQLAQLNTIFNTINQINKVIGMVGSGNILGILGMLGLDVSNLTRCIGAVKSISGGGLGKGGLSGVQGLMSGLQGCSASVGLTGIAPSIPALDTLSEAVSTAAGFAQQYQNVATAFKSGGTVAMASESLKAGLYITGSMSAQSVENTNKIRGVVARQSAVDAMGVAIQGKTYLEKAPEDIKSLSESAKNAKDLRGDVSVNNAIMMKVLEQLQQLNAQMAALNQQRAAGFIANDSHTFSSNSSK
jgi:hypothetical protein